jgi:predicted dienelactone hydrolase
MLVTDVLMLLALVAFGVIWFNKDLKSRDSLLWVTAIAGLLCGVLSVSDSRPHAAVGAAVAAVMVLALLVRKLRGSRNLSKTPVVSGVLFLLLVLVSYLPIYWFPITDLPAPTGPHPAGVRSFELTDESRKGLLGAPESEARRLLIKVWYPAESVDGFETAAYIKPQEVNGVNPGFTRGIPIFNHFVHVQTNAYENAPLLAGAEQLPVVFFSHGYTSFAGQNTVMMEELASRGYLAYSVQHSYDSVDTLFPNGDVIPARPNPLQDMIALSGDPGYRGMWLAPTMDERREKAVNIFNKAVAAGVRTYDESSVVWLDDRLFVKRAIEQGEVDSSVADIAAAGNYRAVGHTGMSFGGSIAAITCQVDPDCAAVVNLDGDNFSGSMFNANARAPFMMFAHDWTILYGLLGGDGAWDYSSFGYTDFSYERHAEAGLRDDFYRLRVKDIQHLGVTDYTLFTRGIVRKTILGDVDGHTMVTIINDFVVGFFDKYVRGVEGNQLADAFAKHSDQVVEHKATAVSDWFNSKSEAEQAALEANKPATVIALPTSSSQRNTDHED